MLKAKCIICAMLLVAIAAVAAIGMVLARASERKQQERDKQAQAAAKQEATIARLQAEIEAQNAKERFIERQQGAVLEAFRQEHKLS